MINTQELKDHLATIVFDNFKSKSATFLKNAQDNHDIWLQYYRDYNMAEKVQSDLMPESVLSNARAWFEQSENVHLSGWHIRHAKMQATSARICAMSHSESIAWQFIYELCLGDFRNL